jgi:FkbH-like protein
MASLPVDQPSDGDAELSLFCFILKLFSLTIFPLLVGVALLAIIVWRSGAGDHLADVLRYWLAAAGFAAEIYLAPFDMITQSVLDENDELYTFKPDIVWIFKTHRDVHLQIAPGADHAAVRSVVDDAVHQNIHLARTILSRMKCTIILNNADLPADDPFGNIAGASVWGARQALRLYNNELAAAAPIGAVIFDLDHLASEFGRRQWFEDRHWYHSKHAFSFDALGLVASAAARLVAAVKGLAKKCLVLDLDNTLWGGVIGDDGMDGIQLGAKAEGEAFMAFQSYLRALKERGIILAVCSKNDEKNAREPFERHPDMKLRLDDIAVFRANWNNKVDNIRDIATTLNIGLDSLVFVDDNPAERDIVRQFLPMVEVPELPDDPSGYITALAKHRYFETTSFSDEDRERSRYYQENVKRAELQLSFNDKADYLASLKMTGEIGSIDGFYLPRMAQLINKSNQFHLTGTRYTEAELNAFAARPDYVLRYFKLSDRFGDNGLISVVILHVVEDALVIDTWVMSCRVLARSVEELICNEILKVARQRGCREIIGTYRPSAKNALVSGLYERLGFAKGLNDGDHTTWRMAVKSDFKWTTAIKILEIAGQGYANADV